MEGHQTAEGKGAGRDLLGLPEGFWLLLLLLLLFFPLAKARGFYAAVGFQPNIECQKALNAKNKHETMKP